MGRSIVDIGPWPDGYLAGPGVGVEPSFGTSALASPNAFTSPVPSGGEH
ncbi:hypothetical protein [Nonomuraea sp. NPDC049695]